MPHAQAQRLSLLFRPAPRAQRVKPIARAEEAFTRERPCDVHREEVNLDPALHPLQRATEATRSLAAAKLSRLFAKPFLAALDAHADGVTRLARSPRDVGCLLSAAADGGVLLWDLPQRRVAATLRAHARAVRGLAYAPDGVGALSCGDDATVRLWRLPARGGGDGPTDSPPLLAPAVTFVSRHALRDVDTHSRRPLFATAGAAVELWDTSRSEPLSRFAWGCDSVVAVQFNPTESDVFATCGSDRGVALFDVRSHTPLRKLVMLRRANRAAWNPREAFNFVVASEDSCLYSFDMRRLDAATCVHRDFVSAVTDVDWSPTGREFVAAGYDRSVRIFAHNGGHRRARQRATAGLGCQTVHPALSPSLSHPPPFAVARCTTPSACSACWPCASAATGTTCSAGRRTPTCGCGRPRLTPAWARCCRARRKRPPMTRRWWRATRTCRRCGASAGSAPCPRQFARLRTCAAPWRTRSADAATTWLRRARGAARRRAGGGAAQGLMRAHPLQHAAPGAPKPPGARAERIVAEQA